MKRLLSLALIAWGALSLPASAGLTQIVGSGTGGNIGSNTIGSGGTTIVITTNAAAAAGSLIVVGMGIRAGSTWTSCTDSASNTYTISANKTGTGVTAGQAWSVLGSTLASGGTITCTNSNTSSKSAIALAFNNPDAAPRDAASATPTSGSSTTPTVGPTGTLSCPAVSGNCEVLTAFFIYSPTASVTEDAAFTNAGTLTANASNTHMAFKLVTVNTAVTYSPTNANSGAWASTLEGFIGVSGGGGGTTFHGLSAMGAGK